MKKNTNKSEDLELWMTTVPKGEKFDSKSYPNLLSACKDKILPDLNGEFLHTQKSDKKLIK